MQGFEAKLYYKAAPLAATPDRTGWTEGPSVMDVTLNDEYDKSDATTRANAGRKATDLSLRDNSLEFEVPWLTTDALFGVLFTAYKGRSAVALACMAGAIDTASGVAGNWKIASFTRSEPLSGQVTAKVTAVAFAYTTDL